MQPFQLKSLWHPTLALIGIVFCTLLAMPANAATCSIGGPNNGMPYYSYSGNSNPDYIVYTITAEADNGGTETDTVTLHATYYDINGGVIGTHIQSVGSSTNTFTGKAVPYNASRNVNSAGTSITLDNLPSGTAKAVHHYEIDENVNAGGSVAASASSLTPDQIVFEETSGTPAPPDA